ncbi:hypothetical protein B0H17DRAFT_1214369 [Mycena rosella]|uniref:F-box domain-containing protein n=1 Tax=Mycena rosella TaxID=1033263 RepID=A0AAD7G0F6_MYCRO|nr:hypothetical protein B0H17DRAFT_1214369 [Mycena rosella]
MHSDRWEHMRFDFPSSLFTSLEELSATYVPLLKTIAIENGPVVNGEMDIFPFTEATTIRGVSLLHLEPNFQSNIPWKHLHHISLGSTISLAEALDLSRQCPDLQTWSFRIADSVDIVPAQTPIYVEHMQRVSVVDDTQNAPTQFFEYTAFPNLLSLEYDSTWMNPTSTIPSLCAPEKLTSLSLSLGMLSAECLSESLRCLPMLQHLILHQPHTLLTSNMAIACPLFTLLGPKFQYPDVMLCPHLESICILGLHVRSDQELVAMINARRSKAHIDIATELLVAGLTAILRYPTKPQLDFVQGSQVSSRMVRALGFRHTAVEFNKLRLRSSPESDWGPISCRWVVEYEEWSLEEELQVDEDDSEEESS